MKPVEHGSTDLSAILSTLATQEAETAALKAEIEQLRAAQTRRHPRLRARLLRAGLAAGLVALLLGTSASAAIPDATTNVMTGCYRTAGTMNLLYVLNTPAQTTCPTGMSITTWPGTYRRIVVVSPVLSGLNEAIDSGAALVAALNGISGASATNPYLLKIEPGVYDLNGGTLSMQPYVDIEGSGEGVTTITSSVTGATVSGADNAELRWLTAQNTGGGIGQAIAGSSLDSTARFTHVTAVGGSGFFANGGAAALREVTTPASDEEGVYSIGAAVSVQDSSIQGSADALVATAGATVNVATSLVNGSTFQSAGTITCVDDYNASFVAFTTTNCT